MNKPSFFSFTLFSWLPPAARWFLPVEAAERFSYYGYRSILNTFLTGTSLAFIALHLPKPLSETEADTVVHVNIALTYLMPVIGGILADWFFGKYISIFIFGIVCAVGHLMLGLSFHYEDVAFLQVVFETPLAVFKTGLFLIAIGAGGLKPNNSGLYGDTFNLPYYKDRIEGGFRVFYMSVNTGSLLAFAFIPPLAEKFSYELAFQIPALAIALSLVVLFIGRSKYRDVRTAPLGYIPKNNVFIISFEWLRQRFIKGESAPWQKMTDKYGQESVETVVAVWKSALFFLFFGILWGVYDLSSTQWITDARWLNKQLIEDMYVSDGSLQIANPLAIILLTPLIAAAIQYLRSKANLKINVVNQILWGMGFVMLATLIETYIRSDVDTFLLANPNLLHSDDKTIHCGLSMWWQLAAYAILTVGEILFSIGGLELGYRFGPARSKGLILSVWYLASAVGNVFVSFVTSRMDTENSLFAFLTNQIGGEAVLSSSFFWAMNGALLVNMLAFWVYTQNKGLLPKDQIQS